jgi:ATP-dependent RNA helicase DDX18/HAS1
MDAAQLSKKRKRKHTKSSSTSKEATPSDSMAKATLVSKADGNKALKKRKAEKEAKKVKEATKEEMAKEEESEKEEEDKEEVEEVEEKKVEKAQNGDNASDDDSDDTDDAKDESGAGDDAPAETGATLHPDRALALSIEDGTTIEDGNAIQDTNGDSTLPPGAQLHLPVTGAVPKLFSELNLHQSTMRAITENLKFTEMTEVQARTIPPAMAGRDVLGAAKTGSGKTLAFLIPAIEMLSALRFKPRNGTGVLVRLSRGQFHQQVLTLGIDYHSNS